MSRPHLLISGAGLAGPVCAYFLAQAGIKSTIIERAPQLRKAGQLIDIRGAAVQVIKLMGIDETIRSKTTKEEGLAFVDRNGKRLAEFPVDMEGGMSFTSDIEILRGDLAEIFYDRTLQGGGRQLTEYVFGDHVTALSQQDGEKVKITFAGGEEREFDAVIGADGMRSKIRRLLFPDENAIKPLGQYTAFFSIPFRASDGTFAQWYAAPRGRAIMLRPDNAGCTRAFLSIMSEKPAGYNKLDVDAQKVMMRDLFQDAGWDALRVLDGMDKTDDFYMQEIAQVKIPSWSKGRVALIGDGAYCPSPISGMGSSLAIIGAYILAGEIASCGLNFELAFKQYEEKMRPYVTKAQKLPPGVPGIFCPQSEWGIKILTGVLGFIAWSGFPKLLGKFMSPAKEDRSLPLYEF